ncbi:MAG: Holliday junction resolvase RuvX [Candidatus Nanopelagicales bacterium]|jgi:putative Holliday junction resolvase
MTAIGIDYGTARIGVARQVPGTNLVVPLAVVSPSEFDQIFSNWLIEYAVTEVYVGLPITLAGETGVAAQGIQAWVEQQQANYPDLSWVLIDERLTSSMASKAMTQAGISAKEQRGKLDSQAAVFILEQALDRKRQRDEEAD